MILPGNGIAPMISRVRVANPRGRFFGLSALLVEDDDRLRRVLGLSLAGIGFAATSAASGDTARVLLQTGHAEAGAVPTPSA
jgi:hypothetical protein